MDIGTISGTAAAGDDPRFTATGGTLRNNGYYLVLPTQGNTNRSTVTPTINVTYCYPVLIPHACTLTEIGVEVSTNGTSSLVRLGAFRDGSGAPGVVVAQGTAATTGVGAAAVTLTSGLTTGWHWFALVQNCTAGSSVSALRSIPAADALAGPRLLAYTVQPTNAGTAANALQPVGYSYTGFSNGVAFTDSPSAGETVLQATNAPLIWFKVTVP